jgi:hypothetical protein
MTSNIERNARASKTLGVIGLIAKACQLPDDAQLNSQIVWLFD